MDEPYQWCPNFRNHYRNIDAIHANNLITEDKMVAKATNSAVLLNYC